jgi:hypothetical protein
MKERGVDEKEAESVIVNPDSLEKSVKGRSNAFKFINGRYLRVTFKEDLDHILVVTVTVRRKPFGGQHENRIQ